MSTDPYVDPRTGVLRNKLGVTDASELARIEAQVTTVRLYGLDRSPEPGTYDLQHLQRIHRRIFEPLYDWAGEIRTVNIAKPKSPFCPAHMIHAYAPEAFGSIERGAALRQLTRAQVIERLPRHLAEVNAVHPFREGNGRAQRAFFSQWAAEAGVRLEWARLDPERNITASQESFRGELGPLRELISELAQPLMRERARDQSPDLGR